MDDDLDAILEHYGVLGMKWGVRRTPEQLARARGRRRDKKKRSEPSEDAARASEARKKAKKAGVQSLSNQELQDLNQRLNLEQQYSKLTATKKHKLSDADKKILADILVGGAKVAAKQAAKRKSGRQVGTMIDLRDKSK